DRFGELSNTVSEVKTGISKCPEAKLVLNADDSLCSSLGKDVPNSVTYYGFSDDAYENTDAIINQDAVFCIYCKNRYGYDYRTYGHLGGFRCAGCGYSSPEAQVTCIGVDELSAENSIIRIGISENENAGESITENIYTAEINLPGLYNIYNALAAAAFGYVSGLPVENTLRALKIFKSGFGRMETIEAEGKTIKVILVKNPIGFNQVIDYLLKEKGELNIAFAVNDKIADGTDISWLWDVDFEKLQTIEERISNIYTSGIRAEDMKLRLKYAGIDTAKISIIRNYAALLERGLSDTSEGNGLFILPTYTAMLDIRSLLEKRYNLKEFWK
ncbi:MAG: MurT ligase domain-containing protein, partial [Eubacteriales bacterium]|nr:MurT ligase domain-containing protein [Eubacteriales bacterium]